MMTRAKTSCYPDNAIAPEIKEVRLSSSCEFHGQADVHGVIASFLNL